jgi:tRNA A37 threonylcarbamoyladenosine synthetase subunit TsaC/SUA5/YrdC
VPGGVASTVLDLTVTPARILRPGPITGEQLGEVVAVEEVEA